MDVQLLKTTRVGRKLKLLTPSDEYLVEYDGYGLGFESVLVDGEVVAKEQSMVRMVPQFDFLIGPHSAVIRIETKLWRDLLAPLVGRLESFVLEVDNKVIYEDGKSETNKLRLDS